MQQFTVPQFIEVEDRVIGPITVRQFIILLCGGLLIVLCYKIFDFSLFLTIGIFIFLVSTTFAFVKINGMPFHFFVLNLLQTLRNPRLRVWKISAMISKEPPVVAAPEAQPASSHYSSSRLNELALIVDTAGYYRGEQNPNVNIARAEEIKID